MARGGSSESELAAQLRLALPLAAQQTGTMMMGLVDTAILGRYHPNALAGAGIGNSLTFAVSCIGLGIVLGLDPLLAQALGAREGYRTPRLLGDGLQVAVRVGALLTLVVVAVPSVLGLAGVSAEVANEARVYTYARALGVTPFLLQIAFRAYLQAHTRTAPLIIAVILGNVANAILDWVLVFGDAGLADLGLPAIGLPAFGSIGAAMATSTVTIATVAYYAAAARGITNSLPAGLDQPTPSSTQTIVRIGLPIGLQLGAEVGAFALAAVLAGRLGPIPAAAHQVAIQLASVSFAVALGIGATASVRVGLAVGRGDQRAARHAGLVSLGLGIIVSCASAVMFVIAAEPLAQLFTSRAEVIAASIPLVQIAAVFQLSDGAQAISAGALRGAGDTRAAFVANLIGHYAAGVPIAILLGFVVGMGAPGMWWGLTVGLTGTAAALVGRFLWLTARPIRRVEAPPAAHG